MRWGELCEDTARPLLVIVLYVALALGAPGVAHGQAEAACDDRLEQANEFYATQHYEEAIDRLSPCLWRSDQPIPYVEAAYRLLALTYLRMDDVPSAKLALVQLIERSPDYRPDPVRDLPTYVSLVRLVRQQVQVPDTLQAATPPAPTTLAPAAMRRFSLTLHAGLTNYHGERSPNTGGLSEFGTAAGPGFSVTLGHRLTRYVDLGLYYLAGRYPSLLDDKGAIFSPIDRGASSDWLHMAGLLARLTFLPQYRASPIAEVGLNGAFSLIDGTVRFGVGPRVGAGANVRLSPRLDATFSVGGVLVVPDRAPDVASASSSIADLFSYAVVGMRYHFTPSR